MVIEKVIKFISTLPSHSSADPETYSRKAVSLPRVRFLERGEDGIKPIFEDVKTEVKIDDAGRVRKRIPNHTLVGQPLSEREKQMYALWKDEQMTNSQIAAHLGIAISNVRSTLSKARWKLGQG